MAIEAVFIDIDNTILDFDEYVRRTMQCGFKEFGLSEYEPWMYDVFTRENNKLWREIEQGTLTFEELQKIRWNLIFDKIGMECDGPSFEKYFRKCLNESAIEIDGAGKLLEELAGRYILCAASNGPYEQQLHRLELADMKKYFDYLFISEEMGIQKPAAGFFEKAFERLNAGRPHKIYAKNSLMIGDSVSSDIAGGRSAGMRTCLFDRNGKYEKDSADIVVRSLDMIAAAAARIIL